MNAPDVLVDARNVARSCWPNVPEHELLGAVRRWAEGEGLTATVVFDGPPPEDAADVLGIAGTSADELLSRRAAELRAAGRPFWLVTSDRALRAEAGRGAERTIGGGAFLRLLGLGAGRRA